MIFSMINLHKIRSLEITTKIGCNVKCLYCPQNKFVNEYKKISKVYNLNYNKFKNILDKIPKRVNIYFSGFSEPFLNKECSKMIKHADQKGFKIGVYTTCKGIKISDIKKIKKIKFQDFVIHLPENKLSQNKPIEKAPLPKKVILTTSQHIGAPAKVIVNRGDEVKTGQKIAEAAGYVSVPIHAKSQAKSRKSQKL